MFTGIVEAVGTVERAEPRAGGARLAVRAGPLIEGARIGDSIAVNGVCLTIAALAAGVFAADLSPETLRRSTLGELRGGDPVNLERPLRLEQRLGGHIVQGHVDGIGTVTGVSADGEGARMRIALPVALMRFAVDKGSVAIDGVSLTIAGVFDREVAVALIPHTLTATTLGRRQVGERVNVEVDILAKYVQRLLEGARGT
jgi:riboflavin synthase